MAGERTLPGAGLTAGWTPGTGGWAPGMDTNLATISGVMQLSVLSQTTSLPGSPADGAIYIVPDAAGSHPKEIAIRDNGAWLYITPQAGWVAWVADVQKFLYYTNAGAWTEMLANVNWGVSTKTTDYTLVLLDRRTTVVVDSATSKNVTVPPNASVAFAIGDEIEIMRAGAGGVVIVPGSGVTVRAANSDLTLSTQYALGRLRKIGTNEWEFSLVGDAAVGAHTHTSSDVTDFTEAAQDAAASAFTGATHKGAAVAYDDSAGTLTITGKPMIAIQAEAVLTNSEVICRVVAAAAFRIPSGTSNKSAKSGVAATGSATFTIAKNGSSVGSIAWSASGTTGSWTFASNADFSADDVLTITGPSTADATLAQIAIAMIIEWL